jgi:hypothetical protein
LGGEVHFLGIDVRVDRRFVVAVTAFGALRARPAITFRAWGTVFAPSAASCAAARGAGFGGGPRGWGGAGFFEASPHEIGVSELRGCHIEAGAGLGTCAAAVTVAAARWRPGAFGARTRRACPLSASTAPTAALAGPWDARIRRAGWRRGALQTGDPFDAHHGVLAAAAKEAATLAFVKYDEFDFVPACAELCERLVKGVFDGFAACFGPIH